MARRRLRGDDVWARLLDPPAEVARLYTLTAQDLALVGNRRTDATRLGYALVLLYLRHPGRVLEAGEAPPAPLLAYVARQISAPASAFDAYAARDATRRAHLADLMAAGGYVTFSRLLAHEMVGFLAASAQTIVQPGQLAGIVVQELRRRRVLVPLLLVLEAVIRRARSAPRRLRTGCRRTAWTATALAQLDGLLATRPPGKLTWLGWLRNVPESPAPGNVGKLLDRLRHVRELGLDRSRASALPAATFERLADEAARLAVQHLADLNPARRYAVLAAAAVALEAALTVLVVFGKLMAQYGRSANEPGVSFYTHVSDQYGPFHTKVIAATAGEAPHVLDGLLYHQSGLQIEEHAVDTGGDSDHCFGLLPFFGYRFALRMRDLKDRRLHLPPGMAVDPLLSTWTNHKSPVNVEHVAAHWEELLRVGTSIRAGTVTASPCSRSCPPTRGRTDWRWRCGNLGGWTAASTCFAGCSTSTCDGAPRQA